MKTPRRTGAGFTLLEVVLYVLVVVLMLSALVPAIRHAMADGGLRKVCTEFEQTARAARVEAVTTGRASRIVFHRKGIELQFGNAALAEDIGPANEEHTITPWPKEIQVKIRPWPLREWRDADEWTWVFQPSGLLHPLQIRFTKGDHWIEQDFNPLTAEVGEERYYLP